MVFYMNWSLIIRELISSKLFDKIIFPQIAHSTKCNFNEMTFRQNDF